MYYIVGLEVLALCIIWLNWVLYRGIKCGLCGCLVVLDGTYQHPPGPITLSPLHPLTNISHPFIAYLIQSWSSLNKN